MSRDREGAEEKMKRLNSNDIKVVSREPSKDTSRINWKHVYGYMPIAGKEIYQQRMADGDIDSSFGSKSDQEMPLGYALDGLNTKTSTAMLLDRLSTRFGTWGY